MKQVLILIFIYASIYKCYAQEDLIIKGKKLSNKGLYLLLDKPNGNSTNEDPVIMFYDINEIQDNKEPVGTKRTFSLRDNYTNIYIKWLNPIKYKITWADTTFNDDRDVKLNDFIKLLTAQFGGDLTAKNTDQQFRLRDMSTRAPSTIVIPTDVNDTELALMYLIIAERATALSADEISKINAITAKLTTIDTRVAENYSKRIDKQFKSLFNINAYTDISDSTGSVKNELGVIRKEISDAQDNQKAIINILSGLSFQASSKNLQTYINGTISSFFKKSDQKFTDVKELAAKLEPLISIVENSATDQSDKDKAYFRVRKIGFSEGKVLQTLATISEFEQKSNTLELQKKKDITKSTFLFQRFDAFDITVSPGIFYGSTSIPGYGIKPKGSEFEVTQDTIKQSTPVPALLANFNFGVRSKLLGFLLQVGVAPAKNRPFLLLGGGISFPSARLAISAGGLWTFVPTLNKLSPGTTIKETTELDKDITYRFNSVPIGWYLGIQYNF